MWCIPGPNQRRQTCLQHAVRADPAGPGRKLSHPAAHRPPAGPRPQEQVCLPGLWESPARQGAPEPHTASLRLPSASLVLREAGCLAAEPPPLPLSCDPLMTTVAPPSLRSLDHVPLPNKNHSVRLLIPPLRSPSCPGLGAALPAHWEGHPGSGLPSRGPLGARGALSQPQQSPTTSPFLLCPVPVCCLPPRVLAAPAFSVASERPFAAGLVERALTGA